MPKVGQDDLVQEWEEQLAAVRDKDAELPGVAPYLERLERALAEAKARMSYRAQLQAASIRATRELTESLDEGRDAAGRLRSYLRGLIGPRNPKLTLYGIAPLGRRRN